jgi:tight adherence protein C
MEIVLIAPLAIVFVAMGVAAGAATWLLTDPQLLQRRLSSITVTSPVATPSASLVDDRLPAAVKKMRSFVPKSPKEMNRIQRLLATAGYHGPWPATIFAAVQIAVPLALFLAVVATFGTAGLALISAVMVATLGYFAPTLWLGRAINRRRQEIQNGLPDAIDLMIVCIESGSGIDQALNRVAEELVLPYPALAKELEMISSETRAGKPRLEAFKNFAARTKVDDVRSLVAMLVQTDRFGTSIGMALRTHAETSRTKRRQRAEEKAAKLAVKLLFPLVFCLFPAFYVVVLGPSMLNIFRNFVYGGLGR